MPALVIVPLALCILLETAEQLSFSMAGRQPRRRLAWTVAGIVLHLVVLAVWLWLLLLLPLGVAMPLMGAGYITIPLASRWLFHERVDLKRWAGIAAIVAGLACIWMCS